MKHGGDLSDAMRRHGGAPGQWLDLSTGINPCPWPVPRDLPDECLRRLPGRDEELALIAAARAAYHVPAAAAIVPAPGTQALIQWLPHLAPPGGVAIVGPTYSEHALSWRNAGRNVIDIAALDKLPGTARHAVIVNPNNPDGRIADHATLARVAAVLAERGGWLVIDEAFADVAPEASAATLCVELPMIILRSFGKFYGLAGLRLGFALASNAIGAGIAQALGPWAVSGVAITIGTQALAGGGWAAAERERLRAQAARLDEVLVGAGLTIAGGTALFRLVRHARAAEIHESLARQRIWVRRFDCAPDLLRFGLPPDDAARERLAVALRTV